MDLGDNFFVASLTYSKGLHPLDGLRMMALWRACTLSPLLLDFLAYEKHTMRQAFLLKGPEPGICMLSPLDDTDGGGGILVFRFFHELGIAIDVHIMI